MRLYILIVCVVIYFVGFYLGLFYEYESNDEVSNLNDTISYTKIQIFKEIFINNIKVVFINIAGFFSFGFFSCINILYNGFALGYVINQNAAILYLKEYIYRLLPHSFEIVAIFWSALLGIEYGFKFFLYIYKGKDMSISVKKIFIEVLICFAIILMAAFVESYISIF